MPTIIISYRRTDSKWITGRIADRLERDCGKGDVFVDIDSIPLGMDFRDHLRNVLDRCDVLLAIIGPNWLARDESGEPRIFDPTDWVRLEIETALAKNIPVIPVLIDRTPMPKLSELPESMHAFAFRQAADLDTGRDFHTHMDRLVRAISKSAGQRPITVPSEKAPADGMADAPVQEASRPADAASPDEASAPAPAPQPLQTDQSSPMGDAPTLQQAPLSADAPTRDETPARAPAASPPAAPSYAPASAQRPKPRQPAARQPDHGPSGNEASGPAAEPEPAAPWHLLRTPTPPRPYEPARRRPPPVDAPSRNEAPPQADAETAPTPLARHLQKPRSPPEAIDPARYPPAPATKPVSAAASGAAAKGKRLRIAAVLAGVAGALLLTIYLGQSWWNVSSPGASTDPSTRPRILDRIEQSGPPAGVSVQTNAPSKTTVVSKSAPAAAAVAQRVVLYEEDPSLPEGQRSVGSVIWRTEQPQPNPGAPRETVIHADIEIPARKFAMTFSLRRNTDDQTSLVSHTVEIIFRLPNDFVPGPITSVPGVLMKENESARGVPLTGHSVNVTDTYYLIGLSGAVGDRERNILMLKERAWFDVPFVYANKRRAIIAIEKGTPGERVFRDAFAVWKQ